MRPSWPHYFLLATFVSGRKELFIQGNSITLVKLARTFSDIIEVILESNNDGAMVTTLMP